MDKLRIDPEFRDKIPPLTDAEFEQLRENILNDGEVYEPIVVWNGTIIDGHNRWRIIQEHPEIPYKVKEMDFADKWEAAEWMYRKQLGRRNLSDEQKKYMIGKMYEARKQTQGGNRGTSVDPETGRFTANGQNVHLRERREVKDGTAGEIGKEIGVDGRTVRRAEKFAKGIDAINNEFPEAANKVLRGGSGITKEFVASIPSMPEEQKMQAIEAVNSGPKAVAEFKKNATMEECNATPIVHEEEYNETDFANQIRGFPKEYDDMLRLFLMVHGDMLKNKSCADAFEEMLNDTVTIIEHYREVVYEYRD